MQRYAVDSRARAAEWQPSRDVSREQSAQRHECGMQSMHRVAHAAADIEIDRRSAGGTHDGFAETRFSHGSDFLLIQQFDELLTSINSCVCNLDGGGIEQSRDR